MGLNLGGVERGSKYDLNVLYEILKILITALLEN